MNINFQHDQSAHCESGATKSLLKFHGVDLSEAMVFGIGSGLFFVYLPFIKVNYLPLTSYRYIPGYIFKTATKRLGIKVESVTYKDPAKAMEGLDSMIEKGRPVGLQVGVFWLPYFPPAYRFHFNAHNIVVYGKENGEYLISDPVMETPVKCSYDDLMRVRFAKGALAPKGRMYYIDKIPERMDYRKPICQGIKTTVKNMISTPIPLVGVRGIRYLARDMKKWPDKLGRKKAVLYLGQLIRMQEEIGTGGAGFRYMFSSFLQEAAGFLDSEPMLKLSEEMGIVGDKWREFALVSARSCKNNEVSTELYNEFAGMLTECSNMEEKIFRELKKINSQYV
jgi:hypothetical protein